MKSNDHLNSLDTGYGAQETSFVICLCQRFWP